MALPTGLQVDIEFTAGVWTNVSAYVSLRQGISLKFGRTDSYGAPQVATAQLRLDNFDGRFTPKSSGSPYYPNVVPRKRLRVSYASGSSPRFVGYIKQWLPTVDGDQHYVTLSATCRLDVLSRSSLSGAHRQAMRALAPVTWLPMDDSDTFAVGTANGTLLGALGDAVSGAQLPVFNNSSTADTVLSPGADAVRPVDGGSALGAEAGSFGSFAGVSFALPSPISTTAYSVAVWVYLDAPISAAGQIDVKVLANGPAGNIVDMAYYTSTPSGGTTISTTSALGATVGTGIVNPPTTSAAAVRTPHLLVFTGTSSTSTASLYLDGVLVGTTSGSSQTTMQLVYVSMYVNQAAAGSGSVNGRISDFAVFDRQLSAGEILGLYNAGANGYAGELSGARLARILGYAGLSGTEYNLATGAAAMGPALIEDVTVAQALQDVADAEGGGAVVYVDVDGKVRFNDSTYRNVATAALTADAEADLDGDSWQPVYDDLERVNDVTYTREGGASVRVTDSASITAIGTVADQRTVNVYLDEQLLPAAQWRLNTSTPMLRIPSVTVDLMTAANSASLYTALASVTIGSMLRVSGLPATLTNPVAGGTAQVLPTTYIDGYVEGWSEQITDSRYEVTFDLSPYIPRHIIANTTWGRLLGTTQTLTSTITSGATSMSLTTSAGPVLTTTGGDYPLYLQIDEEIVSVSSAPGGASPQTLTITRAQLGTIAAAHTAGATVTVLAGALTV